MDSACPPELSCISFGLDNLAKAGMPDVECWILDTGFWAPDFCFINTISAATINKKLLTAFNKKILREKFDIDPTVRLIINRLTNTSSKIILFFLFKELKPKYYKIYL